MKLRLAVRIVAFAVVCVLLGGAGGFTAGWLLGSFSDAPPEPLEYTILDGNTPLVPAAVMAFTDPPAKQAMSYVELYQRCAPAVVGIRSTIPVQNIFGRTQDSTSNGSGFLISSNGYILTNHHVVNGATAVTVTLAGGEQRDAAIVDYRAGSDLALLKIEGAGYPFLPLGDSDLLLIGMPIAAIGNSLGTLAGTMTEGIISGMDRDISIRNFHESMLQISAAVSPGNSGGPVLSMYGEVIGIVTAKSQASDSEGIGFAIPSNTVSLLVDDIMAGVTGGVTLGIDVQTVTTELAAQHSLPLGMYVVTVRPGSNAARAGVRVGDVITAFNGNSVRSLQDLSGNLAVTKDGDTVTLTVSRPASGSAGTLNARSVLTLTVRVIAPQPLTAAS
jgi:serine protease Do